MSESEAKSESSRSWLERLSMALTGEPSSRDELVEVLRASEQRDLLDAAVSYTHLTLPTKLTV